MCTRLLKNTGLNIHKHLLRLALAKTGVTLGRMEMQMKIMVQEAMEYICLKMELHTVGS